MHGSSIRCALDIVDKYSQSMSDKDYLDLCNWLMLQRRAKNIVDKYSQNMTEQDYRYLSNCLVHQQSSHRKWTLLRPLYYEGVIFVLTRSLFIQHIISFSIGMIRRCL